MEQNNRPRQREKNVTGTGAGVHRRGEGQGTGKVGSGSGNPAGSSPVTGSGRESSGRSSGVTRVGGSKLPIIIILLVLLLGGGGGLSSLLGGSGSTSTSSGSNASDVLSALTGAATSSTGSSSSSGFTGTGSSSGSSAGSSSALNAMTSVSSLFNTTSTATSSSWSVSSNTGKLNTKVASGARNKFTTLRGNGRDTVTIMVYMCGTDLESRSAMATKDLAEMAAATVGSNVNIIVYTGGCSRWQNNIISSSVNQIYKVESGGLRCLEKDMGTGAMTNPETLKTFLTWCGKNYPADRNMLIFWDHGGGSLSGYGYDEKNQRSGSMSLGGINSALAAAGLKYDFIGFDACLMATAENALMLSKYADYMIASEETEPGVGWYYTNWLTELSANTSKPTIEIGKKIADDFVDVCAQQCRGQQTTLSVVDLAELGSTFGDEFAAFAKDTKELITSSGYATVSSARSGTREFASSSRIDQIDLVHFAQNLGTAEAKSMAEVLLSAVKYNRTGNMTNAYGLSIYFPYKKVSNVDAAVSTYDQIGLDDEYSQCIREFASLEVSGQVAAGGTGSPLSALFGLSGMGGSTSSASSAADITSLLGAFLGSDMSSISGLSSAASGFLSGRSLSLEDTADYIAANRFDPSALLWQLHNDQYKIVLSQEQWDLVQDLDLNMFYDDGTGYVDLGLDNVYDFDEYGNLLGETDGTWLSINDQPVAYYRMNTAEEGDQYTITGYVPAYLNGEQVKLILIFNDEEPNGYIAGALPAYADGETETLARGLIELEAGDKLDFLCDYYDYDGNYLDSYMLGETMTVTDNMTISNTYIGKDVVALYRFTDIYNEQYWTEPIPMW